MPTVVDSLVVELGLDPSKFTQGQKDAMAAFKQTQEEAEKGGKQVESAGKKYDEFFGRVKSQALGMFAAFFGGRGAKEFVQYITTLDASTGRLSRTLDMNAESLSVWQGVARRTGGSAETVGGTMQGLTDKVQTFLLTGQGSFLPLFNALGISLYDANRNLKTAGDLMLDLNHAVQGMDPARARAMLTALGIDSATVNLLLTEEKALRAMLADQKAISQTTSSNAADAEKLAKAWSEAEQSAENFGRKILNVFSPGLVKLLNGVARFFSYSASDAPTPEGSSSFDGGGTGTGFDLPSGGAPPPSKPSVIQRAQSALQASAIEGYIRQAAIKRGIDPDVAVAVAKSEGLNKYVGDKGTSFGPFQLHYKNNIPGLSNSGLGDKFSAETGLHASDPATVQRQIDFALDEAAKDGWSAWHGFKGLPRTGLAGAHPLGAGAAAAAAAGSASSAGASTVHIDKIEVHTAATDAAGIAHDIGGELRRQNFSASANTGLN